MRLLLCLLLLATTPFALPAQIPGTLVATDGSRFELHSAFWLNLHHFLYVYARAEKGLDANRAAVTSVRTDSAGWSALSPEQARGLRDALAHYTAAVADRDVLFDDDMIRLKALLFEAGSQPTLPRQEIEPGIAGALEAAAPAYRAGWWSGHDAANRAWIESMIPLLARFAAAIENGVTSAFQTRWPARPIRVDVTAYANWAGAYTTNRPSHITISSVGAPLEGTEGVEMLFHEALHTLDRDLARALRDEGQKQGKQGAAGATHAFIFYTAGEVTRRTVGTGHVPYAERYGLWATGRGLASYHAALREHWQPFLDGHTSFEQAIAAFVATLPTTAGS